LVAAGGFPPSFSGPDVAARDIPEAKKSEEETIMRKKRAALINFDFIALPKIIKSPPDKMERRSLVQALKKLEFF